MKKQCKQVKPVVVTVKLKAFTAKTSVDGIGKVLGIYNEKDKAGIYLYDGDVRRLYQLLARLYRD